MWQTVPVLLTPEQLKSIAEAADKFERITEYWQPAGPWPEPDVVLAFRLRKAAGGGVSPDEGIYMFYRQRPDGSLQATLTPVRHGYGTPGPGWVCVRPPDTTGDERPTQPGLYRFCEQRWQHDQMVTTIRDHGGQYKGRK